MQTHIEYSVWFYVQCLMGGLIGIIFYLFVVKLPGLKEKARAANVPFNAGAVLKEDWLTWTGSLIAVLALLYAISELLTYKPNIAPFVKLLFIFWGVAGQFIMTKAFGQANRRIMQIIDQKTNIADSLTGTPPEGK